MLIIYIVYNFLFSILNIFNKIKKTIDNIKIHTNLFNACIVFFFVLNNIYNDWTQLKFIDANRV